MKRRVGSKEGRSKDDGGAGDGRDRPVASASGLFDGKTRDSPHDSSFTRAHLPLASLSFKKVSMATSPAAALTQTWTTFSNSSTGPANVKTWDGRVMYYYDAGRFACALTAANLVQNLPTASQASGQCGAFAWLLESALAMNGIHSNWFIISAADNTSLLVIKNWCYFNSPTQGCPSSPPPSYQSAAPWQYQFLLNGPYSSTDVMVPPPSGGYGDLLNSMGLPGQSIPTPLEKVS
jgi:hypothetical protein